MPLGIPIIVCATDLDPDFYGPDPDKPSDKERLGPDRDVGTIILPLIFDRRRAEFPSIAEPIVLGTSQHATPGRPSTRDALRAALLDAAGRLTGPGDTLFFYYTGHGTRIPGNTVGPDERSAICLTDGFFLDVEFGALWQRFTPGTRIVAVFDCCHAADIGTGNWLQRLFAALLRLIGSDRRSTARALSEPRVAAALGLHLGTIQSWHDDAVAGGGKSAIPVALLRIAACGADELLKTDKGESPFASMLGLRFTLADFANYQALAADLISQLESSELHPSIDAFGSPDPALLNATLPFSP